MAYSDILMRFPLPCETVDGSSVVIGKVVQGFETVDNIEKAGMSPHVMTLARIEECGGTELPTDSQAPIEISSADIGTSSLTYS